MQRVLRGVPDIKQVFDKSQVNAGWMKERPFSQGIC